MKNYLLFFVLLITYNTVHSQTVQSNIPSANDLVNCIVRYNNTIYIGGEFDSIGTVSRSYLGAIDAITGNILSWNPSPNAKVEKMIIVGNKLVVIGNFTTISSTARNRICVFDLITGTLLNSNLGTAFNSPSGLHNQGNYVYYCNSDSIGNYAVRRFDINTLQDDPTWQSTAFGFSQIDNLTSYGNYIYAAGDFNIFNGNINIKDLCRFNLSDGALDTSFHFLFTGNGYLYGVVAHNGKVYVSGNFNQVNGVARKGIAEIDTAGFLTNLNFNCSNSIINALTLQGNSVWVGGNSVVLGGLNRYSIAQIDLTTGISTCWFTQSLSGNIFLTSIWASHDTIYAAPQSLGFKAFTGNPGYINIGNDTILCAGSTLTLNAPVGLSGYQWNTGATTSSITINTPGSYWFSATGSGGCIVTGFRIISACTGIEENSLVPLQIYPTISNGIYLLEFLNQSTVGNIVVYDLMGNIVYTAMISPMVNEYELDIENLSSGMYLCSISWRNKKSVSLKLIKE